MTESARTPRERLSWAAGAGTWLVSVSSQQVQESRTQRSMLPAGEKGHTKSRVLVEAERQRGRSGKSQAALGKVTEKGRRSALPLAPAPLGQGPRDSLTNPQMLCSHWLALSQVPIVSPAGCRPRAATSRSPASHSLPGNRGSHLQAHDAPLPSPS